MADNGKFDPKKYVTKMQGRDYLEVKWRLVWFRAEHPKGSIKTEIINDDLMKATILDDDGRVLSTGHGSSKKMGVAKGRPFEGAETAAIGRALAHAGYGTQFTDELDEGDHLADSPVERELITAGPAGPAVHMNNISSAEVPQEPKRTWALGQKEAIVNAHLAENIHEAKAMLDLSVLPEKAGVTTITSWATHYRAARVEGAEPMQAAQSANEAYLKAKKENHK